MTGGAGGGEGGNLLATQMSKTSLKSGGSIGSSVNMAAQKSKFTGAIERTMDQELLLRRWECAAPVRARLMGRDAYRVTRVPDSGAKRDVRF